MLILLLGYALCHRNRVAWNSLLTPSVSKVIILLIDAVDKLNNYLFVGIMTFLFNYLAVKLIILLIDGVYKRTSKFEVGKPVRGGTRARVILMLWKMLCY